MSDQHPATDLFGEPVMPRREGPGRPEVVWNKQTSDRVLLAFARGLGVKEAADLVGLSSPTLRKVYFSECAKRRTALLRLEMTQLVRLNAQAEAGNVSAERELARRLDQLRMRDASHRQASAPPSAAKPKSKLGKKAEAELRAFEQQGLYEPPAAPSQVN
ncbi:hypothetical protein [uncultured Novosphingobium sp.]|uniref:hypothetical protein n=1 Tax=uncultured Novosphingobium sp. TaxID=292277 RepID=UPI0025827823|nr:hypothetical protein [uncultured Novosphingobium sp.]